MFWIWFCASLKRKAKSTPYVTPPLGSVATSGIGTKVKGQCDGLTGSGHEPGCSRLKAAAGPAEYSRTVLSSRVRSIRLIVDLNPALTASYCRGNSARASLHSKLSG